MNHKLLSLVGLVVLFLAIPSSLSAAGVGDVSIRINGSLTGPVYICENNVLEVWIKSDVPIYEISIGLQFSYSDGPAAFATSVRMDPPFSYLFDVTSDIDLSGLPNTLHFHGVASQPFGGGPSSYMVFSILLYPQRRAAVDGFCVDNIVNVTTGEWSFRDQFFYAPTFNMNGNLGITEPTAPAKCFDVLVRPSCLPSFTSTPPSIVTMSHCDSYFFDFEVAQLPPAKCKGSREEATEGSLEPLYENAWYTCIVGAIDSATGVYAIPPSSSIDTVHEIVTAYGSGCTSTDYAFTIIRSGTYSAPAISQCQPTLHVKSGTTRIREYQSVDPNECDAQNWSLALLSPTTPTSNVSLDVNNGKLTVDAVPSDLGEGYDYRIVVIDPIGLADSCDFQLKVVPYINGDANDNGQISISDVVFIINCIFSGSTCTIKSSMDANCSDIVNISDVVYLINYIFAGGPSPC